MTLSRPHKLQPLASAARTMSCKCAQLCTGPAEAPGGVPLVHRLPVGHGVRGWICRKLHGFGTGGLAEPLMRTFVDKSGRRKRASVCGRARGGAQASAHCGILPARVLFGTSCVFFGASTVLPSQPRPRVRLQACLLGRRWAEPYEPKQHAARQAVPADAAVVRGTHVLRCRWLCLIGAPDSESTAHS